MQRTERSTTRTSARCAIYTRKSSEDGLEQDYNSLDAQRDACEAFIRSQRHEGWVCVDRRYDDGGYSGATLERPALRLLLDDINAGLVNVVVVYKVDRLTRSLADFAKIVETLDARGASFVSVTQQFNTTSSMGRLTLNVLLSFAQFEREVTAERIRDKIAASKKKGMWMGGPRPLGYDIRDRAIVINRAEAITIRRLFDLYTEHGNARLAVEAAAAEGLTGKDGRPFTQGPLYTVLQNPVYVGEVRHGEKRYPGQHEPILDRDTWTAVQIRIAANRIDRKSRHNAKHASLLAGLVFGADGEPFTPTHAVKAGKRYRYYIERQRTRGPGHRRGPHRARVPAQELEQLVARRVASLLRTPTELVAALGARNLSPGEMKALEAIAANLADRVTGSGGDHPIELHDLLGRVELSESGVSLHLDTARLARLLDLNLRQELPTQARIDVPAHIIRRRREIAFIVTDGNVGPLPHHDPALIRAIVRAHSWFAEMISDGGPTLRDLACREGVSTVHARRLLRLAFLAPDIVRAILDGEQPAGVFADRLAKLADVPLAWSNQHRLLERFTDYLNRR